MTPARKTTFAEVTSQLDPGGSVYGYHATDQWMDGLTGKITDLRDLVLELPDVQGEQKENVGKVFGVVADVIAASGIEELTGVGVSGIQITPELHRTKIYFHHRPGKGKGFGWNLFGANPHALSGLDLLSTNTALAGYGDVDLAGIWEVIVREVGKAGVPELSAGLRDWPKEFEKRTKLSWAKTLDSLGGEMGLVLTLDDANRVNLPLGSAGLEFPAPGLMLIVKVENDLIFNRISGELKQNTMAQVTDEPGLKMYAMPLPIPLPMELKLTVATSGDYLFVASSPQLVRDALAVRAGKLPGLRQTAEAKDLLQYLPTAGNQFSFVSRRFTGLVLDLQQRVIEMTGQGSGRRMELFQKLLGSKGPDYGMSVAAHTETGWLSVSVGSQDSATALVAAPVVGVTAVGGAMLLPALAKAKSKAQSVACVNNMKQICLAARVWSLDHGDQFCFNVSTSTGGSLESCQPGGDNYDRSAFLHFQVMSNELTTPKILVCPEDKTKQAAAVFAELQSWNVSYQLRTGKEINDTNPNEVLIYCPIHHHTGRTDGSVQQGRR